MRKLFFRSNSPFITYLFLFLQEEQILKSSKQGRPQDVFAIELQEVPETK